MKNKRAFTLMEVLAVIVILALVALITIPIINKNINNSHDEAQRQNVLSALRQYQYLELNENIPLGPVEVCDLLNDDNCKCTGTIKRDGNNYLSVISECNGKCYKGTTDSLEVIDGPCGTNDTTVPVIYDVRFNNLTPASVDVITRIREDNSTIKSVKYTLYDSNGNIIKPETEVIKTTKDGNYHLSTISYNKLKIDTKYYVQIKVENAAGKKVEKLFNINPSSNQAYEFTTLPVTAPIITFDNSKWEKTKTVTITYDSASGLKLENKYQTESRNRGILTKWTSVGTTNPKTITVSQNMSYVDAKSTYKKNGNNAVIISSLQIEHVDNSSDPYNTPPSFEYVSVKDSNGVNTDELQFKFHDDLSGLGSYCVTTGTSSSSCSGTGVSGESNKWITLSSVAELRDKTLKHQFSENNNYRIYVKDYVGNLSSSEYKNELGKVYKRTFTVRKISYNLNGGTSSAIPNQIRLNDETVKLSIARPTREGYVFLGWGTSSSTHTPTYQPGDLYTETTSNRVLYAIWEREITVQFNNNLGTGSVESLKCKKYNAEATCKITFPQGTAMTRTGYTFQGWSTGQNRQVDYYSGSKYDIEDNMTAYAAWKANALTFNDQKHEREYDIEDQTFAITGASNGNGSYTYSKVSGTDKVTVRESDGALTLKGKTDVGTYTLDVKVESIVTNTYDGTTSVSKTKTMTVKVKPYDVEAHGGEANGLGITIADINAYTYGNDEKKPKPTVTIKTRTDRQPETLVEGTDFTYGYVNNKNAGTATVKVIGKGNYKNTYTKDFTINKYNLSSGVTFGTIGTYTYGNDLKTPTPSVTVFASPNTETITSLVDYSYSNNKNAGTATVYVDAKSTANNFTGRASTTFTINRYDISGATINMPAAQEYTGSAITPVPTSITAFTGTLQQTLTKNTDYTGYEYGNNIEANRLKTESQRATLTITGIGNFTGTKTIYFIINPQTQTGRTVNCDNTLVYNGNEQALIGTVTILNPQVYYSVGTSISSASGTANEKPKKIDASDNYVVYWYAPEGNYAQSSGNVTCKISKKPVTVTAGSSSRAWNGSALTNSSCTITGAVSTSHTPTCTMTSGSTITNAGSVTNTINTVTIVNSTITNNYSITKATGTLTVTLATPTVSLSERTGMTYNGSAWTSNTATVSPNSSPTITYKYYTNSACTAGETTTAPTNAGTYYVKAYASAVTGKTNANSSGCVNHIISAKAITVTAGSSSRAWNGSALTNSSCTASGVVSTSHTPTCTMTSGSTITNAGSVANTINTVTIVNSTITNNYSITKATGTLTVTLATPTVSLTGNSKSWNNAVLTPNSPTVSPNAGGTVSYTYYNSTNCSGSAISSPTGAGNYSVIATVAAVANKTNIAYSNCAAHTISKVASACPTLSNITVNYDGANHYIGVSGGSGGTIQYKVGSGSWSNSNPAQLNAGSQTVSVRVVGDGNHTDQTNCGSATVTVNKITLTVPPASVDVKPYTGSPVSSGVTCPTGSTTGGVSSAIAAGNYTQTCTLSSTTNYVWSDGTTGVKSISWSILSPLKCTEGTLQYDPVYGGEAGFVCLIDADRETVTDCVDAYCNNLNFSANARNNRCSFIGDQAIANIGSNVIIKIYDLWKEATVCSPNSSSCQGSSGGGTDMCFESDCVSGSWVCQRYSTTYKYSCSKPGWGLYEYDNSKCFKTATDDVEPTPTLGTNTYSYRYDCYAANYISNSSSYDSSECHHNDTLYYSDYLQYQTRNNGAYTSSGECIANYCSSRIIQSHHINECNAQCSETCKTATQEEKTLAEVGDGCSSVYNSSSSRCYQDITYCGVQNPNLKYWNANLSTAKFQIGSAPSNSITSIKGSNYWNSNGAHYLTTPYGSNGYRYSDFAFIKSTKKLHEACLKRGSNSDIGTLCIPQNFWKGVIGVPNASAAQTTYVALQTLFTSSFGEVLYASPSTVSCSYNSQQATCNLTTNFNDEYLNEFDSRQGAVAPKQTPGCTVYYNGDVYCTDGYTYVQVSTSEGKSWGGILP